jgi:hypothetical protein
MWLSTILQGKTLCSLCCAPDSTPHCLHHGDKVERMGVMRSGKGKFCARRFLIGMLLLSGHFRPGMSDELPIATWKTASPESQRLDSTVLAEALEYVRSQRLPLHSLLIVRKSRVDRLLISTKIAVTDRNYVQWSASYRWR